MLVRARPPRLAPYRHGPLCPLPPRRLGSARPQRSGRPDRRLRPPARHAGCRAQRHAGLVRLRPRRRAARAARPAGVQQRGLAPRGRAQRHGSARAHALPGADRSLLQRRARPGLRAALRRHCPGVGAGDGRPGHRGSGRRLHAAVCGACAMRLHGLAGATARTAGRLDCAPPPRVAGARPPGAGRAGPALRAPRCCRSGASKAPAPSRTQPPA